jgi:transcriptional regulator with XRE-family HTH domain
MTPLCRLRRFLGLSQIDVQNATGVSLPRLSRAEGGFIKLSADEEMAVREYLYARLRAISELETESQRPVRQ